jgi:CheY-like chemotaxis protein
MLLTEALRRVVPPGRCQAVVIDALAHTDHDAIPTDERLFCAFVSGALYESIRHLVDMGAADAIMGELDWILKCWQRHRQSGVWKNLLGEADVLSGVRLFHIDDEPLVGRVVARTLKVFGADVTTFTQPETALNACIETPPDLILVDMSMPYMSGATVASVLHLTLGKATPPVVCLTASYPLPKHEDFDAVLMKPVHPRRLVVIIHALLAQRDASPESEERVG